MTLMFGKSPRVPGHPASLAFDVTVEQLVLITSIFWALSANRPFLSAALAGRSMADPGAWAFGAAMVVLVVALNVLLLGVIANRYTVKPVLAVLTVCTAIATYTISAYGVYLDPSMLRNALRTDMAEAVELMNADLALHLVLYAGLPLLLLQRVRVVNRVWHRAAVVRIGMLSLTAVGLIVVLLSVFQPFAALIRNHREVRYLITPGNYLWSLGALGVAEFRVAASPRQRIGLDAAPGTSWASRKKPLVLVLVIGETARAANWGLSGYARQTTPQLASLPVVNFAHVTACGTSTEASLPCMFAPVGRRDYDEARIRGQESLLHVVARAGAAVHWRDNQSGCKGVCDGLPSEIVSASNAPGLCGDGRCFDEGLLYDIDQRLQSVDGTQLWVLHMLGNHGPPYFRRHPPAFAQFQPECRDDDLRRCSTQEIVNAYDNALLYTDHVLSSAIAKLRAHAHAVDSALIFVSDHGESLGENGLFLHGVPYAIAPDVQTHVPMVLWASAGFEKAAGLDRGCLQPTMQKRAAEPVAHDNLFHTVLGLLDIRTALYQATLDLSAGCRNAIGAQ